MLSPSRLAIGGAVLVLSSASLAKAQSLPSFVHAPTQTPYTVQQENPSIRVDVTKSKEELRLQVELHDGNVIKAIDKIANAGNLQVVVKVGVGELLRDVSVQDATPEIALQKVCEAAGLGLEFKDGVWFVSPTQLPTAKPSTPKIIDSMSFADVEVTDLLSIISQQFDVAIAASGDVKDKVRFIRLQNKTPRQAVEIIAQAVGLMVTEAQDGTLIVAKGNQLTQRPAVAHPPLLSPSVPEEPATPPTARLYLLKRQ